MFCNDGGDGKVATDLEKLRLLNVSQHLRTLVDERCTGLAGAPLAATDDTMRAHINDLPEALKGVGFDMVPAKIASCSAMLLPTAACIKPALSLP